VDDVDLLPDKPDDQPIIAQWYVWIREWWSLIENIIMM
jgi:hypothetical protein